MEGVLQTVLLLFNLRIKLKVIISRELKTVNHKFSISEHISSDDFFRKDILLMPRYTVASYSCGRVFKSLLVNRLKRSLPQAVICGSTENTLTVETAEEELSLLALALAEFLTIDLRVPETARLSGLLPLDLRDRQLLLPKALQLTDSRKWVKPAAEALHGYLETERFMVAEGFLRFRLQQTVEEWAAAVDRAGAELLLQKERMSLMLLIAEVMQAECPESSSGAVRLILHGDGACTLTDENGCRIESTSASEPGIIGLLLGLAPECVEVYDLTDEGRHTLTESIREVFGLRARIFVKRS